MSSHPSGRNLFWGPRDGQPRSEWERTAAMSATTSTKKELETLRTLPGDDVRQILWRFADRYDLQMLVQSVRAVARGTGSPAGGGRGPQHPRMDAARRMSCSMNTTAPASAPYTWNRAMAATSRGRKTWRWRWWPSSWPGWTPGAATGSLAGCLALAPIHERGTPGAAGPLHGAVRARPHRPAQAVARRFRADRATALRRSRNRPAVRQAAHLRVGRGEASPLSR